MTPGFYFSISVRQRLGSSGAKERCFEFKANHSQWARVEVHPVSKAVSILIGKVKGDMKPSDAVARLRAGEDLEGRFLAVEWNPQTQILWVSPDPYRRIPVLWMKDTERLLISNSEFDLYRELNSGFASENMLAFLLLGYSPPGLHFLRQLKWLNGPLTYSAISREVNVRWVWGRKDSSPFKLNHAEDVLGALEESLANIIHCYGPKEFRLSGGLDTRLVGLLLKQAEIESLDFVSVCHPELDPSQDADIVGAQMFCNYLGKPLTVLRPKSDRYFFFVDPRLDSPTLSGFYGGELLGGTMLSEVPKCSPQFAEWLGSAWKLPEETWSVAREIVEAENLRRKENGGTHWASEVFMQSDRSTIYNSFFRSWASPVKNNYVAVSPFTEDPFLDLVLSMDQDQLREYRLYTNIYRRVAEDAATIPLSSQANLYHSDLPGLANQTNPKAVPRSITGPSANQIDSLVEAFNRANLPITIELLSHFLKADETRIKFLNLSCWFRDDYYYRIRIQEQCELASAGAVELIM